MGPAKGGVSCVGDFGLRLVVPRVGDVPTTVAGGPGGLGYHSRQLPHLLSHLSDLPLGAVGARSGVRVPTLSRLVVAVSNLLVLV